MTHPWTDRLSDYVDGELEGQELRELEAHVSACAECRETLVELRAVVARAASAAAIEPARDLWPEIEARIAEAPAPRVLALEPRRRFGLFREFTLTFPQLAAAGFLVAVLSGAGVWFALSQARGPAMDRAASLPTTPSGSVDAVPVSGYERTIAELEGVLEQNRHRLDAGTVAVLEDNLAIIDAAIGDSRRALAADPASPYLYRHLDRQMRQKVDLLRQAAVYAYAGN